ncbi:MAG: YlmH/Sll1252 family protein [Lachnospiraceae bacterium]|nr:YlmH/Sll1252 family protein [Lachnospiraceae bacterium]
MSEQIFNNHIHDLSSASYRRNVLMHTDFLAQDELAEFKKLVPKLENKRYVIFGGYEYAERALVIFLPDYEEEFDNDGSNHLIDCLKIEPVNAKFADELSHRDYLGALMNLGIERRVIGDIVISENKAYLFCLPIMTDFIKDNLQKVKHTMIKISDGDAKEIVLEQRFEHIIGSVASERLDAIVSFVYKLSRGNAQKLIDAEKVFVNGMVVTSAGKDLKPEDRVSVRGYGKFIYKGYENTTRKGRLYMSVDKFV